MKEIGAGYGLSPEEIYRLESLADVAGIDTRGDWEHTME